MRELGLSNLTHDSKYTKLQAFYAIWLCPDKSHFKEKMSATSLDEPEKVPV